MENAIDKAGIFQMTMTKEQAAEALGVSRPTIDKLIRNDETFPSFGIGKRIVISTTGLHKWIERNAIERSEIRI